MDCRSQRLNQTRLLATLAAFNSKETVMSKLRTVMLTAAVCLPLGAFAGGGKAFKGHPNMMAAAKALDTAWEKITAAQKANEYDLGGHAAKAKDAIKLAMDELKLAAQAADKK